MLVEGDYPSSDLSTDAIFGGLILGVFQARGILNSTVFFPLNGVGPDSTAVALRMRGDLTDLLASGAGSTRSRQHISAVVPPSSPLASGSIAPCTAATPAH